MLRGFFNFATGNYLFFLFQLFLFMIAACAEASRAMGTLKGEQLT